MTAKAFVPPLLWPGADNVVVETDCTGAKTEQQGGPTQSRWEKGGSDGTARDCGCRAGDEIYRITAVVAAYPGGPGQSRHAAGSFGQHQGTGGRGNYAGHSST